MHFGQGFAGLRASVVVQFGEGGVGILHSLAASPDQEDFRLLEAVSAGVHQGEPASVAVGSVRIGLFVRFQFLHHLGRKAQRAPAGEKMPEEFTVLGDFEGVIHLHGVCFLVSMTKVVIL